MKKVIFYLALAFVAGGMLTSCDEDNGPKGKDKSVVVTFEDVNLQGAKSIETLEYTTQGASFSNFNMEYGSYTVWGGFAYGTEANNEYTTLDQQFQVYNAAGYTADGAGAKHSHVFAIGYTSTYPTEVEFSVPVLVKSFYLNNTAYVINSIENGDSFAKKFGEGDWFLLTITGYTYDADEDDYEAVYTEEIYLADYRSDKPSQWTLLKDWKLFDGISHQKQAVDKIRFTLSSTDVGAWGMNTPAYFAIDNLKFEPTEVAM